MRLLDKLIRSWRVKVALGHAPPRMQAVFDIGCDDGFFLRKLQGRVPRLEGIDPEIASDRHVDGMLLGKGHFPGSIVSTQMQGEYDGIFALAVFEHFSAAEVQGSAEVIERMLSPEGRLILTVPHPFVDKILDALMFLRLIDGQALEQHHGFETRELISALGRILELVTHETFQFGLNNVLVFRRKTPCS